MKKSKLVALKKSISKGETKESLKWLLENVPNNVVQKNQLIILNSRFIEYRRKEIIGDTSNHLEKIKIINSTLSVIDDLIGDSYYTQMDNRFPISLFSILFLVIFTSAINYYCYPRSELSDNRFALFWNAILEYRSKVDSLTRSENIEISELSNYSVVDSTNISTFSKKLNCNKKMASEILRSTLLISHDLNDLLIKSETRAIGNEKSFLCKLGIENLLFNELTRVRIFEEGNYKKYTIKDYVKNSLGKIENTFEIYPEEFNSEIFEIELFEKNKIKNITNYGIIILGKGNLKTIDKNNNEVSQCIVTSISLSMIFDFEIKEYILGLNEVRMDYRTNNLVRFYAQK